NSLNGGIGTMTFSIQIDAKQLFFRWFQLIPNLPGKLLDASSVQTVELEPGQYTFVFGEGAVGPTGDFPFGLTDHGRVDYDAKFDAFLEGRGTMQLTLKGLPATFDAQTLPGSGILFVGSGRDPVSFATTRLVPATGF